MEINQLSNQNTNSCTKINKQKKNSVSKSFTGRAKTMPQRAIHSATDAIKQWEILKHPKYTDIYQPTEKVTKSEIKENQEIRNFNYAFLDKLSNCYDKQRFIEYFTQLTGFPKLNEISEKILSEFKRVVGVAANKLEFSYDNINLIGYDRYCSVGLKKALPGSDIDKAFVIIPTSESELQQEASNKFKGYIWDNIDNRIMSVNHYAAFPNVMTEQEVTENIEKFDKVASKFVTDNKFNAYRAQRFNPNLISGAKFNIFLSERLDNTQDKIDAKNLAYIVEAIRDGEKLKENYEHNWHTIYKTMERSRFGHCTNVTQARIMQDVYDYSNEPKPKIVAREKMEQDFNSMDTDEKYDLVKDVIRSMSGDNRDVRFKQLFTSKPDTHSMLLTDILIGNVDCCFEHSPECLERCILTFSSTDMMEKYVFFNVYSNRF